MLSVKKTPTRKKEKKREGERETERETELLKSLLRIDNPLHLDWSEILPVKFGLTHGGKSCEGC